MLLPLGDLSFDSGMLHGIGLTVMCSGPAVIKLSSCSTQTSMSFQLLIKTKTLKIETFLAYKLSNVMFHANK